MRLHNIFLIFLTSRCLLLLLELAVDFLRKQLQIWNSLVLAFLLTQILASLILTALVALLSFQTIILFIFCLAKVLVFSKRVGPKTTYSSTARAVNHGIFSKLNLLAYGSVMAFCVLILYAENSLNSLINITCFLFFCMGSHDSNNESFVFSFSVLSSLISFCLTGLARIFNILLSESGVCEYFCLISDLKLYTFNILSLNMIFAKVWYFLERTIW